MSSKARRKEERTLRRRLGRLRRRGIIFAWQSDARLEAEDGTRAWGYEIDDDDERSWKSLGTYFFIWVDQALRPYTTHEAQLLVERLEKEHADA